MDFLPAAKLVSRVVERRTTLPILMHARVTSDGKTVTLIATNLDTEVRAIVDIGAAKFDTCAPAVPLVAAARTCSPTLAMEEKKLLVGDDPRFTLNTMNADDFPTLTAEKGGASFNLPADQFAADLRSLRCAISTEETRYYLNGIYFHVNGGKLTMAATDGHRLIRMARPAPAGAEALAGSILPRQAVSIILAAIEAQPSVKHVALIFRDLKAQIGIGDVTITTKLIDGTYPDYARVVLTKATGSIAIKASSLSPLAGVAEAFGERPQRIALNFAAREARIKSPENGDIVASLEGEIVGTLPDLISFNARYLHDILETRSDETFTLGLSGPCDPALFTCSDPAFTGVLMPTRPK